jgi:hypothetical protein
MALGANSERKNTPLPASLAVELHSALSVEIKSYYELYVLLADLKADEEDSLLGEALGARLRRSLDRICLLLGMLYPDG